MGNYMIMHDLIYNLVYTYTKVKLKVLVKRKVYTIVWCIPIK